MRWTEAALFLAPFFLFAAWRVAAARATPVVVWVALAAIAALAVVTIWLGLERRVPPGARYVPARTVNGVIVPGHGVGAP